MLLLLSLGLFGYVLWLLGPVALCNDESWWQSVSVWLVGAAVVHDLLLFPVYAAADRLLIAANRRHTARPPAVPVLNFVRLPLMACALVTLLFLPGIIRQGAPAYARATGQTQEPFLLRWLLLCAAILLVGFAAYVVSVARARRRHQRLRSSAHEPREPHERL